MVIATTCSPIENGAVMSGEEFLLLYEAATELEHVELIEGIIYMPSPVSVPSHGQKQLLMLEWLATYAALHSGVEASGPGTVVLDSKNVLEPDGMLFRMSDNRFTEAEYLAGAPELAVEIANSSASRDLHQKKEAYRRNGVREYIVWRVREEAIDWFELVEGEYVLQAPGLDGVVESVVFPGLRLNVDAMLGMDRKKVLAAVR